MLIDKISYGSSMRYINPGIKFLFGATVLILLLLTNKMEVFMFNFIVFNLLIIFRLQVTIKEMFKLYVIPAFFLLTTALSIVFVGGDVKLFLARAISSLSVVYTLICSTPIVDLDYVFMKIKMPKIFRELFLLIYKYIFILFDVKEKGMNAQRSRLGYVTYKQSLKSFTMLVVSIFNKTNYYSYNSARAMESRLGREFLFYHRNYGKNAREIGIMVIIVIINIFLVMNNA